MRRLTQEERESLATKVGKETCRQFSWGLHHAVNEGDEVRECAKQIVYLVEDHIYAKEESCQG